MSSANDKFFLQSEQKIINGIAFSILFTVVETKDKKYTRIGIKTCDEKFREEETYSDALQMQDIDFLIDRMAIGLISRIKKKKVM